MIEALVLLAVTVAGWLYIWNVERPRHERRRRDALRAKGYGFLIDDEDRALDQAEDEARRATAKYERLKRGG